MKGMPFDEVTLGNNATQLLAEAVMFFCIGLVERYRSNVSRFF